ncbi:MAG: LuxR C-terminal-related transcriptional regulator [Myxococcales bacterium]|nr:LuxR C-terminal-related transcriptional regulator [Myxococcales bacterium]
MGKVYGRSSWGLNIVGESTLQDLWHRIEANFKAVGFGRLAFIHQRDMSIRMPPSPDEPFPKLMGSLGPSELIHFLRDHPLATEAAYGEVLDILARPAGGEAMYVTRKERRKAVTPKQRQVADVSLEYGFEGCYMTSHVYPGGKYYSLLLGVQCTGEIDLLTLVSKHRGDLVHALLTLTEATDVAAETRLGAARKPIPDKKDSQYLRSVSVRLGSLSPRERDCLAFVAVGMTSSEIGERLNISDRTVSEYLASATKKLEARNRTHAVVRAIVAGLLSNGPG